MKRTEAERKSQRLYYIRHHDRIMTWHKKYVDSTKEWQSHYYRMRRYIINLPIFQYKQDRGCDECGEHDLRVLEFHHKSSEKKYMSIAHMMICSGTFTVDEIIEEAKKCSVLCCNCHAKKHRKQICLDDLPTIEELLKHGVSMRRKAS